MCHNSVLDTNFYVFLLRIDEDLAAQTQAGGCRRCGSVLHKNRYERHPRGGGLIALGKGPHFHLSLSCSQCEKRHSPASVRFLGRRVYLAAMVVLASAFRSGLTDRRARQLTEWLRVPKATIERWRTWWVQDFVESSFWKIARAVHATGRGRRAADQPSAALQWSRSLVAARCTPSFPDPAK
jgi:hypothetical protein